MYKEDSLEDKIIGALACFSLVILIAVAFLL